MKLKTITNIPVKSMKEIEETDMIKSNILTIFDIMEGINIIKNNPTDQEDGTIR